MAKGDEFVAPPVSLPPLSRMAIDNFIVFKKFDERFTEGVNLIIGGNGAGKSVFLRLSHAAIKSLSDEEIAFQSILPRNLRPIIPFFACVDKILGIDSKELTNLINNTSICWGFDNFYAGFSFGETGVLEKSSFFDGSDAKRYLRESIFIHPHELISSAGTVVGLTKRHKDIGINTTEADLAAALLAPELAEEYLSSSLSQLCRRLESVIGGRPHKTAQDRFVLSCGERATSLLKLEGDRASLVHASPNTEYLMPLVAEGHRKLAQLMQLIQNGSITPGMTLFWDEPETNLNPALQRLMAVVLVDLAAAGVQVFAATHSFFLMKEISLEITRRKAGLSYDENEPPGEPEEVPCRFFSFSLKDGKVEVERGDSLDDLQSIASLDAAIEQEDRAQSLYARIDR